jgi:U3 small nucleolar RNA-associated protein 14
VTDFVQDFAAEKSRQVEADAPKTQDTSLPGWVSFPLPTSNHVPRLMTRAHGAEKEPRNTKRTPSS